MNHTVNTKNRDMRLSVCSPEALYVTESHTNGIETDLNSNKRLRKGLNDL